MTKWEPKSRKEANAQFRRLMDREVTHVRVQAARDLWVQIVGTLAELHRPDGVCTCCARREERSA